MTAQVTSWLRERKNEALAELKFGAVKFFTPKEVFWQVLEPYKIKYLIDAGAGMGHVTDEAVTKGFMMTAIDVALREGQSSSVIVGADATTFPYTDVVWPIICRPDHEGWCYETIEAALKQGAGALYVGLAKNVYQDLGKFYSSRYKKKLGSLVGEDGESIWVISPRPILRKV